MRWSNDKPTYRKWYKQSKRFIVLNNEKLSNYIILCTHKSCNESLFLIDTSIWPHGHFHWNQRLNHIVNLFGMHHFKLWLQSCWGQESNPLGKSNNIFLILFQFDKEKIEEINFGESRRFTLLPDCNASRIALTLTVTDGKYTVLDKDLSIDLSVGISISIIINFFLICYQLLG